MLIIMKCRLKVCKFQSVVLNWCINDVENVIRVSNSSRWSLLNLEIGTSYSEHSPYSYKFNIFMITFSFFQIDRFNEKYRREKHVQAEVSSEEDEKCRLPRQNTRGIPSSKYSIWKV